MRSRRTRRVIPSGASLGLALLAVLLCTAPTPGDVGGCGQPPRDLDPEAFFRNQRRIDCERCRQCGLLTERCTQACDRERPLPTEFPEGCYPLVHDGEVCLRALDAASCSDYAEFMRDAAPSVPSECNFCPPREDR